MLDPRLPQANICVQIGRTEEATFAEAVSAYVSSNGEAKYLIGCPVLIDIGDFKLSQVNQQVIDRVALEHWSHAAPSTRSRQCYGPISAVLKFAARRG